VTSAADCPCGSGISYTGCCQPLHQGLAAASPEALMRSRYTAFYQGLADYLLKTWHSSTRPVSLDLNNSPQWTTLQVLSSSDNGASGQVHFRAIYRAGKEWGYLEEQSDFLREEGHWYYLSGNTSEGQLKPGRNDPCLCGSGRKHKNCCLAG